MTTLVGWPGRRSDRCHMHSLASLQGNEVACWSFRLWGGSGDDMEGVAIDISKKWNNQRDSLRKGRWCRAGDKNQAPIVGAYYTCRHQST